LSIGGASKVKNDTSITYLIPPHNTGMEADSPAENNSHTNAMLTGEVAPNLTTVVVVVTVKRFFGLYADILGLLDTMWLQQQVVAELEPKSSLTLFAEVLGNAICTPHIKR
jgi:hypothetical protein